MRIEIISVNAVDGGAEMVLTVQISDENEHSEKRKLLIFTEQYFEHGLARGSLLDEEELDELERLSGVCVAVRKGGELLSYSPSSKRRLVSRLRAKGIDRESAEGAAERLLEMGAIDERGDAMRATRSYLKKLWGRRRIRQELIAKGYESEYIDAALAEIDEEQLVENCAELIGRKDGSIPSTPEGNKKMIAALVRYGYSYAEIRRAIELVSNTGGDENQ